MEMFSKVFSIIFSFILVMFVLVSIIMFKAINKSLYIKNDRKGSNKATTFIILGAILIFIGNVVTFIFGVIMVIIGLLLRNNNSKTDLSQNINRDENKDDDYYYKNEEPEDDISQREIHKHDGWNNNDNPIKYK